MTCRPAAPRPSNRSGEEYGLADKHAVFIDSASYAEPRPVHICRDPEAHGHTQLRHTGYVSPEAIARREAEEAARREHAEKMSAARDVRAKFLRSLIGSQKAAAKHTDLLLTIAARWPDLIAAGHRHPLAEDQEDEDQEDEPGADETGQDGEHDAPAA